MSGHFLKKGSGCFYKLNNLMDIKILRSKINLMEAQVRQFCDSGLFNTEEIDKLTMPLLKVLDHDRAILIELQNAQDPKNIDVVNPHIL